MTSFSPNLPLWYQLTMMLRSEIISGARPVGSRIEAEVALAKLHGVSVMPVRRALGALEAEGLIERQRGRGTFVRQRPPSTPGATSLESLYTSAFERPAEISERRVVMTPEVFREFFPEQDELVCIRRLAFRDGIPWSYGTLYFLVEYDRAITTASLRRLPLYRVMEEACGVRLRRTKFEAKAVAATPELADRLGVEPFSPLLHMSAASHDTQGAPVGAFDLHFVNDQRPFAFETFHDSDR